VEVDELYRAGEAGDLVGDAVLQALAAFLGVLQQRRVDRHGKRPCAHGSSSCHALAAEAEQRKSLERVSQRSELAGADQRAGQVQECGEEVGVALVADGQAPVGQQPGQRSLDLLAMTAQQLTGLDAMAGDPRADPSSA
jgi:hypothetical protein